MNENKAKVKVKLAVGYRRYKIVEVEPEEVKGINAANRMIWQELAVQRRRKKKMEESGITICSMESIERDGAFIPDTAKSVLDNLIENEEHTEIRQNLTKAMKSLTARQKHIIREYFWNRKTFRQIAQELGVHHSSVEESYAAAIKKLKNFMEIGKSTPPKA